MQKLADIFINIPVKSISRAYSYTIPEQFDFVKIGCRVIVPFGGRLIEGFIIKIYAENEARLQIDNSKLKPIKDIIDSEPWFTDGMYKTAKWMADFYLCSLGETMRLFIPGKNSVKIRAIYNINEESCYDLNRLVPEELQLYQYIKSYSNVDLLTLRRSFNDKDKLLANLEKLLAKKLIQRDYTYHLQAKKIYATYAVLNVIVDDVILNSLHRKKAQQRALFYFKEHNLREASVKQLGEQKISLATLKALAEANYLKLEKRQQLRDSYQDMMVSQANERRLTQEQQTALQTISNARAEGKSKFLLFGITGSGKTQVYIEMARQMRAQGKQVLILVPEIVLTGQIVVSFKQYFADDVAVIHSRLSISERNDTFWRIRTKQVGVIIGARSAIFAPFEDLGLIVMDEEHDPSYKQDESPRYHSHDIVEAMGKNLSSRIDYGQCHAINGKFLQGKAGDLYFADDEKTH